MAARRYHGNLDMITDSERRALRPIGSSAYEVAARTGALLADLMALPGVRIFQGVRPVGTDLPRIAHAVTAGRRLILVESVAWPPGEYTLAPSGRVLCDGTYIGQSVRPLIVAVQHWREALPNGHRVCAAVVVHTCADGDPGLPPSAGRDLLWMPARDAVPEIQKRLLPGRTAVGGRALAALVAATLTPPP